MKGTLADLAVAPLAGAWIEISERRGYTQGEVVAPLAGAWIEILTATEEQPSLLVAPLAGAWIEIARWKGWGYIGRSLPSRERGLK